MRRAFIYTLAVLGIAVASYAYGSRTSHAECVYNVETPYGTDAYLRLADARNAMLTMYGINPDNTPYGYDITSKAGC